MKEGEKMKVHKIEKAVSLNKKRVAAYCRVSTDSEQQNNSYETQIEYYTKYICENKDWIYAGVFHDHGITGTSADKRLGFQNMIKECEIGNIDLILVKSISRFARNTVESLHYIKELQSYGVEIYFEKEKIYTLSGTGQMLIALLSQVAESESIATSTNKKWGIQKRMENGTFSIKVPPYGYDRVDGGLVINPYEASIVRFIFDEYLEGKGCRVIAKFLTESEFYTRTGNKKWSSSFIDKVIKNPVYSGDLLLQKTITTSLPYRVVKNFGEENQYLYEDDHTPIITREESRRITEIRERRKNERNIVVNKTHKKIEYLFTSKIYCGKCGNVFIRQQRKTGNHVVVDWVGKDSGCCINVNERNLKTRIAKMLYGISVNDFELLTFYKEALLQYAQTSLVSEINSINIIIEEKYRQIYKISSENTNGNKSAFCVAEINSVEREIENLKEKINLMIYDSEVGEQIRNTEAIKNVLKNSSVLSMKIETKLLKLIIKKVIIYGKDDFELILINDLKLRDRGEKNG